MRKIYTDYNGRVISLDSPPDQITDYREFLLNDDKSDENYNEFASFSDARKLCYMYFQDSEGNISFWPAMDIDTIDRLDETQTKLDNMNDIIDMLIIESLEG